ncbi:MAG: hypothetical protein RIR51_1527 [Bacteroidota bacterium]|jgi:ABC-type multidrug transport system fused ATPase/permease subunit
MAKRSERFGAQVDEKDKVKVSKDGAKKVLKIFSFIYPYKTLFIFGLIFLVLSNLTTLSFPLLIGEMTRVIEGQSKYQINQVTLFFFGVLSIQAILSFARIYTFSKVSEYSMRDVRLRLFNKIITLPMEIFEKRRVGEMMSRISSDVTQLRDILSTTIAEFFRQVFTLVGGIGLIIYLSWKLTLFMIATFPLLVGLAFLFGRKLRKISKDTQDELANSNIIVEESFQQISVVKAFTSEKTEIKKYTNSLQNVVNHALKAAYLRGGFVSFVIFALFGGIVGVVWYGSQLVDSGEIVLADLLTFIFYTIFIGGSIGGLGDLYAQIQRTIGSSSRIIEILNDESEIDTDENLNENIEFGKIEFKDISFHYPSRKNSKVISDFNFSIEEGEKVALVGASGAGKSTIIQLIMRFYQPDTGKIIINGRDIEAYNKISWRKQLALVPQEVILFGGTIKENIAYGNPEASDEEIMRAAELANAKEFIESFPEKWETTVGERGIKLSGGQKQRVAIARAILKDPKLLLLDEATSALDSESEKLVQDALEKLLKNRTSLIIAHRLSTIRNADKIIVIEKGSIVEMGTHENLMKKKAGIYQKMVKLQTESLGKIHELN